MSRQRILGNNGVSNTQSEPPSRPKAIVEESLICPICNKSISNLTALNIHVDKVHLSEPTTTTTTTSSSSISIPKSHFKKARQGAVCSDARCSIKLGLKNGILNCPKCGDVFCKYHCQIPMKIDSNLRTVAWNERGVWCMCCRNCFDNNIISNDNDNDIVFKNYTTDFIKLRKIKRDEDALLALVLERRLEKLVNWIVREITVDKSITSSKFYQFEKSLSDWENSSNVIQCKYCAFKFGLFNRKHHCRVCGDVVCGEYSRGCSMIVPLGVLFKLMSISMDINENDLKIVEKYLQVDQFALRVCKGCKMKVLDHKVFLLDVQKGENSEFMSFQKLWKLLHAKLERENLDFIKDDDENLKLVQLFTRLDKLIKNIDQEINLETKLRKDEIRILQNLKSIIISYVQLKLPILRKAQDEKLAREREKLKGIISDQPKLTLKDIREKREKLMVLSEQRFLVENMYEEFKKQRRFDDLKTLDSNLSDINAEIDLLTKELGDESFTA